MRYFIPSLLCLSMATQYASVAPASPPTPRERFYAINTARDAIVRQKRALIEQGNALDLERTNIRSALDSISSQGTSLRLRERLRENNKLMLDWQREYQRLQAMSRQLDSEERNLLAEDTTTKMPLEKAQKDIGAKVEKLFDPWEAILEQSSLKPTPKLKEGELDSFQRELQRKPIRPAVWQ